MRIEGLSGLGMNGDFPGQVLPAADCRIDIKRIDFDQPGAPTGSLRSNQRRSGASEWIEDDVILVGTVADRIGNQSDRLHSWMERKLAFCGVGPNVLTRVVPHMRTGPAEHAEVDVVDVGGMPFLEYENQLVFGAVKRSHACV